MFRILLSLVLSFSTQFALAQEEAEQATAIERYGPRRQISTIVYMGLAGAVLGLSTLSFYGRPQDHLTNIPIGFGVGVIFGTVYMTYQAATNPDEFYRETQYRYKPQFHHSIPDGFSVSKLYLQSKIPPTFKYRWSF